MLGDWPWVPRSPLPAAPVAERDGVLTVRCEAAVWSQELELMAADLLGRLNAALGEELLHKLRCRVG